MKNARKTVLLADNHPIFRAGIRSLIEAQSEYEVIADVADGAACVAQAELLGPDILVIDLSMPGLDGFEVARWARAHLPSAISIIVSMHSGREFVRAAKEAGAHGFVSKEDAGSDLMAAIGSNSGFYMSSSAGREEAAGPELQLDLGAPSNLLAGLSRAELNVLKLVAQSNTSREISEVLGISERTVHSHRQNISTKLDLHGSNSLLQFAIRNRRMIETL